MRAYYVDDQHNFVSGTTFEEIINLYYFDGELKLLLLEVLEKIEINFKTKIINELCSFYQTAHRFMKPEVFITPTAYSAINSMIVDTINKNKDSAFIKHYYQKYDTPDLPAIRMILQIMPFGAVCMLYNSLGASNKKIIAKKHDIQRKVFSSRIVCMAYLRNLSAHSDRVRNRTMTKKVNIFGKE